MRFLGMAASEDFGQKDGGRAPQTQGILTLKKIDKREADHLNGGQ
jgi:hypothetical protein